MVLAKFDHSIYLSDTKPSCQMPPRRKRAASAASLQLTASSSREDVEAWLQFRLPSDLARDVSALDRGLLS